MKNSRYSGSQDLAILKQAEAGTSYNAAKAFNQVVVLPSDTFGVCHTHSGGYRAGLFHNPPRSIFDREEHVL